MKGEIRVGSPAARVRARRTAAGLWRIRASISKWERRRSLTK